MKLIKGDKDKDLEGLECIVQKDIWAGTMVSTENPITLESIERVRLEVTYGRPMRIVREYHSIVERIEN